MSKFTWSYGAITSFEKCPKQYYHLKIEKDYKEPFSKALKEGNEFHTAAENYVRNGTELPDRFVYVKSALDVIVNMEGIKECEYRMALTENLEPCEYFDDKVWWRGVADIIIFNPDGKTAKVIDYKTGSNTRYADKDQLELMAMGLFKHFPKLKKLQCGLLYVQCNTLIKETYRIKNEPEMWTKWLKRVDALKQAKKNDVWNPNPSGLCKRHCVVTECIHNGRN